MILSFYSLFAIGIVLTSYYNSDLINSVGNNFGLVLVIIGLIGFYGIFIRRIFLHVLNILYSNYKMRILSSFLSVPKYNLRENIYIYTLIANLTFRLILFQFVSKGNPDSRSAAGQPYYIICNTFSVVFLSILHSRQLKHDFSKTQVINYLLFYFLFIFNFSSNKKNRID